MRPPLRVFLQKIWGWISNEGPRPACAPAICRQFYGGAYPSKKRNSDSGCSGDKVHLDWALAQHFS